MSFKNERGRCFQGGFGLIELMVAMVIGLLIILGASQLYLTSHKSFSRVDEISRRQEIINYLSSIVSQEIRISNGSFYPASDKSAADESGNLFIALNEGSGLDYDPYCGAAALRGVEYFVSEGSFNIAYDCFGDVDEDGEDDMAPVIQPIIEGISKVVFSRDEASTYIDVEIFFPSYENNANSAHGVKFRVANRISIISKLN